MEELERYGFLAHIDAVSAVSGGTLPGVYYVLRRSRSDWSWSTLRRLLGINLYRSLLWKHLNPYGLFRYLRRRYTRSDMMAEIFDEVFFNGATFGDFRQVKPTCLINTTDIVGGQRWTLSSDIDEMKRNYPGIAKFPLSLAVSASASLPYYFSEVAYPYFVDGKTYHRHLLDGGLTDNLGLEALLQMYHNSVRSTLEKNQANTYLPECFIFLIDSYPDMGSSLLSGRPWEKKDLRRFRDLIRYGNRNNVEWAFDVLMACARDRFVKSLTGTSPIELEWPLYDISYIHQGLTLKCKVWHFYYRFLLRPWIHNPNLEHNDFRQQLRGLIPTIETHWKLKSFLAKECSSSSLQDALYDGAQILIREDHISRNQATEWLETRGLRLVGDSNPTPEADYRFFRNNKAIPKFDSEGHRTGWSFCRI